MIVYVIVKIKDGIRTYVSIGGDPAFWLRKLDAQSVRNAFNKVRYTPITCVYEVEELDIADFDLVT